MSSSVRKKRRNVRSSARTYRTRRKPGKSTSAIGGEILHGMPHGTSNRERRRTSKTQKRPSVPFGGQLSARERAHVFECAAAIQNKALELDQVDARYRPFVQKVIGVQP